MNLTMESNDLPPKLAILPHPASSLIKNLKFFHYNNSPNAVYQEKIASIQPNYKDKVYFGVAEKSFKD